MERIHRLNIPVIKFCRTAATLLGIAVLSSCSAQSKKESVKSIEVTPKTAPESLRFAAHITESQSDGSKTEIDTVTGYRKYYYSNGKLQMEGKVTKASPKDYRDGIWNYYSEEGLLMKQEESNKEGKLSQLDFMYFSNGKPMSRTYEFFEGDYKDQRTFKFHKIETMFYTSGQQLAERHWINNELVGEKCWDSKGNPKPIEYCETVKSFDAD